MQFYSPRRKEIGYEEWLTTWESYYFLKGPTLGRRLNGRSQTSEVVEDKVCALLTQASPLSSEDLSLAMAWKIGLIDHNRSQLKRQIIYRQNWLATLVASGQFGRRDFSKSIPYLTANMAEIMTRVSRNPEYLFNLAPVLEGFGPVYILTVLFFFTGGRYPIYDRYAHIAALAIQKNLPPESCIEYKGIQKWADYAHFIDLLTPVRSLGFTDPDNPSMFVSRTVDRALWAYGHSFQTNSKAACA